MSFSPNDAPSNFVPPNIIIPDDWQEAQLILTDYLVRMANAVNAREIAQYMEASISGGSNISEVEIGQQWFDSGDPQQFRYASRTVVDITAGLQDYSGAVTTQSVAHGISVSGNTTFTRIYGVANDSSLANPAMPLPFVDADALANAIELNVDSTNVNLRYNADYSAYDTVYIILEYIEGR